MISLPVTGSVEPLGTYTRQLVLDIDGQKQTVNSISALPGLLHPNGY